MAGSGHDFKYSEDDGVATILLDRPKRRNALTPADYQALRELTAKLKYRQDLRVVVIRGTGDAFCAGGDLDQTAEAVLGAGTRSKYEFMRVATDLVRNIREMPQPVVAVIDGPAAGAGAALALAADFRVLSERATLAFVFTSIGLSGGDMGSAWILQRFIGLSAATEVLMLGQPLDAQKAYALGIAHRLAQAGNIEAEAASLIAELKKRSAIGLRMTKEILNRTASADYATGFEMEAWTQSMLMADAEFSDFLQSWIDRAKAKRG